MILSSQWVYSYAQARTCFFLPMGVHCGYMKDERLSIRISHELKVLLQSKAEAEDVDVSDLIRDFIKKWVKK